MGLDSIEALTFDTGGTVLDWHSGFREAFARAGARHGLSRDWAALANELRRRSMAAMLNLGEHEPPAYNFDAAHRTSLEALLAEQGLTDFDQQDRRAIAWEAPHRFDCWADFPAVLPALRARYISVSFSLLSYRLVIDTARHNGLLWDAVLSCEGMGVYKLLPAAYQTAARRLQLAPAQCCMVACHPWDLDAAAAVGFRTAFVRRPLEWGGDPAVAPWAVDDKGYDIVVEDFPALARALGVAAQ